MVHFIRSWCNTQRAKPKSLWSERTLNGFSTETEKNRQHLGTKTSATYEAKGLGQNVKPYLLFDRHLGEKKIKT